MKQYHKIHTDIILMQ